MGKFMYDEDIKAVSSNAFMWGYLSGAGLIAAFSLILNYFGVM